MVRHQHCLCLIECGFSPADFAVFDAAPRLVALEREIIEACRRDLAPHKVPALIRFVPALPMSATGKLVRHA